MPPKILHWDTLVAADWSSDLNLSTISGMPARQPDELHVYNTTTTAQNLVINTSNGATLARGVHPGNVPFPLHLDAVSIDSTTGANIVVVACWYGVPRERLNA